jgi:DHA1 family bicyclomycin/chloramphenicol resistance-like MFS transporter
LVGPGLGGQVLALSGWRAIFWTLVGVGILTLTAQIFLPDTLPPERRNTEPLMQAFARYKVLVRNRRLLAYMGTGSFYYAGTFAYVAGSPFAYIVYHHLPAQLYGVLFGAGIIGIMATNLINRHLVPRFGSDRLMIWGNSGAAVAGMILAVDAWTDWGGLAGLAIPLFFYVSVMGFIIANAISGALAMFPERTGAVSALVGSIQYGGGIVGSALIGVFADDAPSSMGLVIAVCAICGMLCTLRLRTSPKTINSSLLNENGRH